MINTGAASAHVLLPQVEMLGEACVIISWGNLIDQAVNKTVHRYAAGMIAENFVGVLDIIPSYASLSVLIDLRLFMKHHRQQPAIFFETWLAKTQDLLQTLNETENIVLEIPVCYDRELGNDLKVLAEINNTTKESICQLHASASYFVYMIGFLPGFAYMGEVDDRIAFPRKEKPVPVTAGAVAIAGKQTGIYPADSPGGWNVVGYTPLKMFDKNRYKPCLLEPGAIVRFSPIDIDAYHQMKNNSE